MSEQAPMQTNEEYLAHHPDAVVDTAKAEHMAYAEKSGQEYAATRKRTAEILGDSVVSQTGYEKVLEESLPYAHTTDAIQSGAIDAADETWIEELERRARTNIVSEARYDQTPRSMEERFDHAVRTAKKELDHAKKNGEEAGRRYDSVKEKIDGIK